MAKYLSLAILLVLSNGSSPDIYKKREVEAYPLDFDCPMRQLALEFAMKIQPNLSKDHLQEIADALNGAQESVNKSCVQVPQYWKKEKRQSPNWNDLDNIINDNIPTIFVDYNKGNDNNDGSIKFPLKHLDYAILFARKMYGNQVYKRIILREGKHYARSTINITTKDNNLLISNYNNEKVILSAAKPITCTWETENVGWNILNDVDGIYGGPQPASNTSDGKIIYIGKYNSVTDCENAIKQVYKEYGFGSFTWEDNTSGAYANMCYGQVGNTYKSNKQSGSYTGVLINIYKCQISDNSITEIDGLRINGKRAIRARYPNGNPEVYPCGFCSSLTATKWLSPTCTNKPDTEYYPMTPNRTTSADGEFVYYQLGVGGCCDGFTPNAGYWCGNYTQGGGAFTYLIPSGIDFSGKLPNAPYKTLNNAVIQTWRPGHWSSWMFEVDGSTYDANAGTVKFKKGGFQGARGNTNGDEFFIENVFEELDYPTEYYFDETNKILYYYNNGSGTPDNIKFEVTYLKVLMSITGESMSNPVKNQIIRGLTMSDAKLTYLDPHGMPSGGDWGLQRTGALFIENATNITIDTNILTRLDGNAISINKYARDISIINNEIVWQGDNAVSLWGDTEYVPQFPDGTTMGYDGTNGNQPRGVLFKSNFVHEIGISEKQSSMWFQAKSCSNILDSNIFFNGPRAGINFNDGFGGNSTIKNNLVFNTCRESGDHGPFNSWDRQVYVTKVLNGTATVIKAFDEITKNFMIANYNGQEGIDNDDGSCYYNTHSNFLVYSGNGMKNDFGGHDNFHYNNVYGYVGRCFGIVGQKEGHRDGFYNNTCVLTGSAPSEYGSFDCATNSSANEWPLLGNNIIYQQSTDTSKTGLCNMNEAKFQATYPTGDPGTVINGPPNNAQIIAQAKSLLF